MWQSQYIITHTQHIEIIKHNPQWLVNGMINYWVYHSKYAYINIYIYIHMCIFIVVLK